MGSFGGADPTGLAGPVSGGVREAYGNPGSMADRVAYAGLYREQLAGYFGADADGSLREGAGRSVVQIPRPRRAGGA